MMGFADNNTANQLISRKDIPVTQDLHLLNVMTASPFYRYWNGARCEVYDAGFPGGIGQDVTVETTTLEPLDNQRQLCISAGCPEKAADGQCDRECDSYACDYDGGDCSFGNKPWQSCGIIEKVRTVKMTVRVVV